MGGNQFIKFRFSGCKFDLIVGIIMINDQIMLHECDIWMMYQTEVVSHTGYRDLNSSGSPIMHENQYMWYIYSL